MSSSGLFLRTDKEVFIMKTIGERLLSLPEVLERVAFGKTVLFIKQGPIDRFPWIKLKSC